MPRKNSIKTYVKNGHYHIYNRGVEKRIIFQDEQDYKVFLSYLKFSLTKPPKPEDIKVVFTLQGLPFKGVPRMPKKFFNKIELVAYCLMPNHFHLLIKQNDTDDMRSFITSLITRYSMYFNKKYDRVGSLFQGPYKAVLVLEDKYLLHLSRYIHLNPSEYTDDLVNAYSSYGDYLKIRNTEWIKPDLILKFFKNKTIPEIEKIYTYKRFVENYKKDSLAVLGKLILEK